LNSWTRTLNLDDAHSLLALVEPGMTVQRWATACHAALPHLSAARRRELIRLLRDGFLDLDGGDDGEATIANGRFLAAYMAAPAIGQLHLVDVQWAMSHPLTLIAVEALVTPALASGDLDIPLQAVEDLVRRHLETESAESLRTCTRGPGWCGETWRPAGRCRPTRPSPRRSARG
jgi:hypothetical protein